MFVETILTCFVLWCVFAWFKYRRDAEQASYKYRREAEEWYVPPEEAYYLIFKNDVHRKVRIHEVSEIEAYVQEANRDFYADNPIVRIVSQALQGQRLACGRDGTVWPKVPEFSVHFHDGEVSILNLEPDKIDQWVELMDGEKHKIVAICDESATVIWPARDGSKKLAS
jgi:hypothetical protein